jgi:hypothetical protein
MTQYTKYIKDVSVLHATIFFPSLHLAIAAAGFSETSLPIYRSTRQQKYSKSLLRSPQNHSCSKLKSLVFKVGNDLREKRFPNVAEGLCVPHSGPDLTTSTQLDTHICYLGGTASSSGPHSRITYRISRAIFHCTSANLCKCHTHREQRFQFIFISRIHSN